MFNQKLWQDCVNFHGHLCSGIAIGFRVAYYALELLSDEMNENGTQNVYCITNTDKCPCDGIRFLIGATEENNRLSFDKSADNELLWFKFYILSDSGENLSEVEFRVKAKPDNIKKEETVVYYLMSPSSNLFEILSD